MTVNPREKACRVEPWGFVPLMGTRFQGRGVVCTLTVSLNKAYTANPRVMSSLRPCKQERRNTKAERCTDFFLFVLLEI